MARKTRPFVAILVGSDSDLSALQPALEVLDRFGIGREVKVTSAHRTPEATHAYVQDADQRGCAVFIAVAGMAAHLAGAVAALTTKPVIGVPVDSGPLCGFDALLSTVQMPGGIPVACVAIGSAGAKNAGYLAAEILALGDPGLAVRLRDDRAESARNVQRKDRSLQKQLSKRSP
ncbi:MAG: 5-(carboxyamino)imidazole ribonucleotide mutase [Gammaproteobacteria bacterium]|nr:5-(carboxyamino)imidazole ribonucleotide mutase [Gammaproteobacteria bacterium]